MTNPTQAMKEASQRAYYSSGKTIDPTIAALKETCGVYSMSDGSNNCLAEIQQLAAREEWRTQATVWMLVVALLLWLITYTVAITLTTCFDFGIRSMSTFTTFVQWSSNGSQLFEDGDFKIINPV